MKKNNLNTLLYCLIAVGMISIFGCKKKDTPTDSDTTVASQSATVQEETNNVLNAANSTYHDQSGNRILTVFTLLPACATVTGNALDTGALKPGPHADTINFGATPCQCTNWDNKFRKGMIIVSWNGGYRDSGGVVTIRSEEHTSE